jgi:hypothetical protein
MVIDSRELQPALSSKKASLDSQGQGLHNKAMLLSWWLKQKNFIFSPFWRLEVQDQDNKFGFF